MLACIQLCVLLSQKPKWGNAKRLLCEPGITERMVALTQAEANIPVRLRL